MTTTVSKVTDEYIEDGRAHILQDKDIPSYAAVYRIHGPFLFGVTDKISAITDQLDALPPIVILRLRNMTAVDATGIAALEELADISAQERAGHDDLRRAPATCRADARSGIRPPRAP